MKPPLDGSNSGKGVDVRLDGEALNEALQYGPSAGLGGLRAWLSDLQAQVHKRPEGDDWAVSVGSGSQDLMSKVR